MKRVISGPQAGHCRRLNRRQPALAAVPFHSVLAFVVLVLATNSPVRASLIGTPIFDVSIASDPNAAAIEGTINSVIASYNSLFTNTSVNATIDFKEGSSGLAQSSTFINQVSYTAFRASLASASTSSNDATALSHLPVSANEPTSGNPNMWDTLPNLRALGFSASPPSGSPDGTISLNTALMFFPGFTDPTKFSLQAVVEHQINEVLGLRSGLDLPTTFPRLIFPGDLFRYAADGTRSFTTSASAQAFFSLDGTTHLAQFNQLGGGSDYGDWQSNPLPSGVQPQVQDAFGTPGVTPALGVELTALDVIGYNLTAVPEPGAGLLVMLGLVGLATRVRRRRT